MQGLNNYCVLDFDEISIEENEIDKLINEFHFYDSTHRKK